MGSWGRSCKACFAPSAVARKLALPWSVMTHLARPQIYLGLEVANVSPNKFGVRQKRHQLPPNHSPNKFGVREASSAATE